MFPNGFFGNVLSKYGESSETADSILNNAATTTALTEIKPAEFFLCVGAALVIGFLISLIYIATHKRKAIRKATF